MREYLKKRFPNATKYIADRYRWYFRCRQEYGPELRYRRSLSLSELKTTDKVLEVGHCNYQTIRIAKKARSVTVCNISGINRSVKSCGPRNLNQLKDDICTCAFEPHTFDTAFVIAVLEHIEDDTEAVRNLFRVLKPGGRLIVYVPDTDQHFIYWKRGEYPGHVRPGYTKPSMTGLLSKAGFDVVHCELENGIYSAVASDLYYAIAGRFPFFKILPYFVIKPFMSLAALDNRDPGSLRWGLYCKAIKPL